MRNDRERRAFAYLRVSTDRQADQGQSLPTQRQIVKTMAKAQGRSLDQVFIDRGVSGSIPFSQRPAGSELLATVVSGDVILLPKLDRGFRSALDALETVQKLKQMAVDLFAFDLGSESLANGHAKMFLTIASAFAEAERDRIALRISEVKKQQAAAGRFLGGRPPFGYSVNEDGQLIEERWRSKLIKDMRRWRRRDGKSLAGIAALVEERGFGTVTAMTVRKLLGEAT